MCTDFVSCNGLLGLIVVIKVDEYIWAFIFFFNDFLFFLNLDLFSRFSFFVFNLFGFSFFHFFGFLVIILGISPLTTATT